MTFRVGDQPRTTKAQGTTTAQGPQPQQTTPGTETRPAGWIAGTTAPRGAAATAQAGGTGPNGGVTELGLNPAVAPERQRATFENIFRLGRELAAEGKVPVIAIDHRHTGLDDRPIVKAGLKELADRNNIPELKDVDAALANGTIKFLPGYTEQASDHWRAEHPELVAKYPDAFGAPGSRIDLGFMNHSPREANAVDGLAELEARWKLETGGKGKIIFVGAGSGTAADFASVYQRPKSEGGAGLSNPDVRHGAPSPSPEADARATERVAAFNARHPDDPPVRLDHDSRGKAGWVETLERERGPQGEETVVAAFIDDRAHNRIASAAAGKLGDRMMMVKSASPGISFAQLDNDNANLISTFKPNP